VPGSECKITCLIMRFSRHKKDAKRPPIQHFPYAFPVAI
jgi:hypothetical protein